MSIRAALVTGTSVSLAATAAWAATAALAVGPPQAVRLDRDLPADYARLACAATGSGLVLFAVLAVTYALCFLVSGLRARAGREPQR